jgi:glucose-6-phosphate isomerase
MRELIQKSTLGKYARAVEEALAEMSEARILGRVWERDHTVWSPDPTEIANRLGWLDVAERTREAVGEIEGFREAVRRAGMRRVLLLGMGGSSLAPEVFSKVYGSIEDGLPLSVLDSTDADAVREQAQRFPPADTLYVVATKSGSTVETLSFFKYFYNLSVELLGEDVAGSHFVAITDPGSNLERLAEGHGFLRTFLNDPHIGGRYSALSYFGIVPAALAGVDVRRLLDRAVEMGEACRPEVPVEENPAAWLGAVLGELARAGRDKLTLVAPESIEPFGDWVEQLIAESTGKEGMGILPVVRELLFHDASFYGDDRIFVHLNLADEATHVPLLQKLEVGGHPVVRVPLTDLYDLGGQFFLWELATAVAGARLDIHPFNQPNVEAAKVQAKRLVKAYKEEGSLPEGEAAPLEGETLAEFLAPAEPGDYVAIQAYVHPTPAVEVALEELRRQIVERTRLATTIGYGPRFLHSTGQLHKGDAGNGCFVQFTSDSEVEVPIPDEAGEEGSSLSFNVLKMAQALGDYRALEEAGRRVIRFHLGEDVVAGIHRLAEML